MRTLRRADRRARLAAIGCLEDELSVALFAGRLVNGSAVMSFAEVRRRLFDRSGVGLGRIEPECLASR